MKLVELARGVADSFDAVVAAVDVISVVASVVTTSVLGAVIAVLVSTSSALTALAKMAVDTSRVDRVVATIVFFFITKKNSQKNIVNLYHNYMYVSG